MQVINPVAITPAMLTSSSVPETDYAAWVAGTTYTSGAQVIVAADHKIYQSLQNANTGNTPNPAASTAWWQVIGSTNRWKAFDGAVANSTSQAASIQYVLTPGIINSIAFLGMDAASINVAMTNGGVTVYNNTLNLTIKNAFDWYQYLFFPILYTTDAVLLDLPPYLSGIVTITITKTGGTAKAGEIVLGQYRPLGITLTGTKAGIVDYSTVTRDTFGNPTLVVRNFSKKLTADFFVENYYIGELQRVLASYRATPVVWIGDSGYTPTIVYGFFRDFEITMNGTMETKCSMQIEGLT